MKNPFMHFVAGLYQKLKPVIYKKNDQKILRELLQLYPSGNSKKLYDNYQFKKFSLVFLILVIGIVSAICLHLSGQMEGRLAEGARINRNEWGVGNYEIELRAKTEEWSREISFLIEERKLTNEEKRGMIDRLRAELPSLIKRDNQDLQHIVSDLNLPSSVAGYPFRLTWSSTDNERVNYKGEVNRSNISKEGEQVVLTTTLAYEEERISFTYEVTLLPEIFDEEEGFFRLLKDELQTIEQKEKTSQVIILPEDLDGKQIVWTEVKSDRSVLIILVSIFGSMMICMGMDNDLKKNCERRRRQLLGNYSEFVSKLRLYLSAGLTVKSAFVKIVADYEEKKDKKVKCYLYEEMKIVCHQLENGMMEERVYQEFGKRCDEMRYRRLSFLLSVHLKQGNSQLLQMLEREADSAMEDRRNMAKKAGEEAGTKLLFPMMLMMLVVMFLILLPAYFNFGSI